MNTKVQNIVIEKGADFYMSFRVTDDEDNVVDLTGATVTAHLREYAEADEYIAFTTTHNGAGGKVTLTMPHEDTAQIGYTQGVYDVFVEFPDESVEKYLMGEVTVIPAVTRPVDGTVIYMLSFASADDFPEIGQFKRLYFSRASGMLFAWTGTGYEQIGGGSSEWGQILGNLADQTDLRNALGNKANVIINTVSGKIASIADASHALVTGLTIGIEPIQSGSGDPSPDNIRPISGRSEISLKHNGKNLLDCQNAYDDMNEDDGWYVESSAYRYKITGLPASTAFTLSCVLDAKLSSDSQNRLYLIGSNSGFIDLSQGAGRYSITKNSTANGEIVVSLNKVCRADIDRASHILNLQVELGSQMTEYEEYRETVYTISLGQTVYGGSYNASTGVLTVTDGNIASYDGETLQGEWISDRDVYAEGTTPTTGAQVVYKLAIPQTVDLDAIIVYLEKGNNNLMADSGNVSVEYRADTKLYIDSKLG